MTEQTLDLENFILGETNEEFICFGEEDIQHVTLVMIRQSCLHLDILSHDLAPVIYDNEDCCDAIETLALNSRHSRIRILLADAKKASRHGHCLFDLGRRLGSLIEFGTVADCYNSVAESVLLADDIGFIYGCYADSLTATVNFKDAPRVKELAVLFDTLWFNRVLVLETRVLLI
jgi:hypothetical protein